MTGPIVPALVAACAFAFAAATHAQGRVAVPPATARLAADAPREPAALRAPGLPALRVELAEPAAVAPALAKDATGARATGPAAAKHRPLVVGYPREAPAAARRIALARLDWHLAVDGTRVARVEVHSPLAAALRLTLDVHGAAPDLALRFAGNAPGAAVHGPVTAQGVAAARARAGGFVTPLLEGDTAIVEISAAPGRVPEGTLELGPASHLVAAGAALAAKSVADIGRAGACNLDVACVAPSAALVQAASSVGKLVFSDRDGYSYACTGTLINDSVGSFTPYLLTAAHCIEGAYEASTVNVYWLFRAAACGSLAVPPYVLQGGGAALLARSDDRDWALLRLASAPPAGVRFAAWRAEPVPASAPATGLHHPLGDLEKFSEGTTTGYESHVEDSTLLRMQWSQGTTEVGSSGSGLFTFLSEGGYYELRGTLFGGAASCSNRSGPDYYSRLDGLLPLAREYLTPDAPAGERVVVVEYYHRELRHYFITAAAHEIAALDGGAIRGWERTGVRFLAHSRPAAGTSPVCRYYLSPAAGNSHFYSPDPAECARVARDFTGTWIHESDAVFHIALPDPASGACPDGTRPLWRFFNAGTRNHRYTPELTLREAMRSSLAWTAEGYGFRGAFMCSPSGE